METLPLPTRDERSPRWVIPAILAFFLVVSLPSGFYAPLPNLLSFWLPFTLALLAFIGPLFIGLLTRLPRWSLLYIGVVLGGVGVYGIFLILGLLLSVVWGILGAQLADPESLIARLSFQWIYQGALWLAIALANGLFLALVAFAPGLRSQRSRFWNDFSLVSFLLYGGILVKYLIDFDEYRHEDLFVFASMAGLALGAWGYLRAKTPGWRTLALLAGLTVCMASMSLGKYFLVPLQEWGPWLPAHPPETERWFESLQTIAAWFWAALFIGLPGLIQTLRKTPPHTPYHHGES